eukprot:TRINITY_DN67150_c11_g2_i1.p1 TRINITY_DN67150_c11_g2~~TRINITY_DN67150_c11_g2_i1.p1  ORF type:complete len:100 (+),score=3.98 TRINITY_DN67150_c11_g2_i1:175-474(+)
MPSTTTIPPPPPYIHPSMHVHGCMHGGRGGGGVCHKQCPSAPQLDRSFKSNSSWGVDNKPALDFWGRASWVTAPTQTAQACATDPCNGPPIPTGIATFL